MRLFRRFASRGGMTWTSACRHLYRKGSTWKGRSYIRNAGDHCNSR